MLLLLSPAKSLDFTPVPDAPPATAPRFQKDAASLARTARALGPERLGALMDLSPALSQLNAERFRAFDPAGDMAGSLQAALAFNGDVYRGLDARSLGPEALVTLQARVRILSGLYGLLRPLDAIQPHRLEMGTRLVTRRGASLYEYWGPRIARLLAQDLADSGGGPLVNLASEEYFRAVDLKALKAPVISCQFREDRDGLSRIISFHAKAARGLMARFAVDQRVDRPEGLKDFTLGGYGFDPAASDSATWVFRRAQPEAKAA